MLTKEQILRKLNGFESTEYLIIPYWQPIYDQCVAAIDLAAENEELQEDQRRGNQKIKELSMAYGKLQSENAQLKATLDAVRAECKRKQYGFAEYILKIIDKEADT